MNDWSKNDYCQGQNKEMTPRVVNDYFEGSNYDPKM